MNGRASRTIGHRSNGAPAEPAHLDAAKFVTTEVRPFVAPAAGELVVPAVAVELVVPVVAKRDRFNKETEESSRCG